MADIRDASALARKPSGWGCPRLRDTRLTRRGGLTGGCQMGPTATMSASPVSAIERESAELRARRLAAARRRATALLAGGTGLFGGRGGAGVARDVAWRAAGRAV